VPNSPNNADQELQDLKSEVVLLRERLALLSRSSREISASLDQPTVLEAVVDAACRLTSARYGALAVFDEAGLVLKFITRGVTEEQREGMGSSPVGRGLLGWLQHSQEPLRVANLGSHPESSGFPPGHPSMTSFLGVPIRQGDEALGNIYLTEKLGEAEFSQDDEDLLVHFAAQAAIAIRNARRFQSEQESRLEAEAVRNRLETLVNTSPVGVLVADAASGDVVLGNREAERLLGISDRPDDIKSALDSAAVFRQQDGREMEPEEQPLQRALYRGENSRALEMHLHLPDGRTIPTLVNASPI
jgi:GAF domain-containing protein